MQTYFYALAEALEGMLTGDEVFTATFHAETSDFVRFNRGKVRQAGQVAQAFLRVQLVDGRRQAVAELGLSGDAATDRARLGRELARLRGYLPELPEDPHLLYATEVRSSERTVGGELPSREELLGAMAMAAGERDLVGIYAAGPIYVGFANSLGQRNWHATSSFNLDWSFYRDGDKAVKCGYAGFHFDRSVLERKVHNAARELEALGRPAKTIPPGQYRVYLAPAALAEVLALVGWGGFGLKAHRTKQTPLLQLVEGGATLHRGITLYEHAAAGVAPSFDAAGYLKPDRLTLIDGGTYRECLVSARSAKEYGVPPTGASGEESPESLELLPGTVGPDQVLSRLERGVLVGNLWYLNFSDRMRCRITGMTRFATFWVEGGEIVAPLNVMRFDETIYRALGTQLLGLTSQAELLLDADTYSRRSTRSARVPGALIDDFTFTL